MRAKTGAPLAFAGLWETWTGPNGEEVAHTAAIVTTRSTRALAAIHERMPVIVAPEAFDLWLDCANRPRRQAGHPAQRASPGHAYKLGCEGIVSKRRGSRHRSGTSSNWIKVKNPSAPAVRREAEEDWGRQGIGCKRTSFFGQLGTMNCAIA